MDYQVVIGRDLEAGVWIVRATNIQGLSGEDTSLDNLLAGLPATISWLFSDPKRDRVENVTFNVTVETQTVQVRPTAA
jgi:hypothetical protein